jgi:predicted dithiol-disulfide oxidoreductase (DUF899 family)
MLAMLTVQLLKSGSGCPDPCGPSREEGRVNDVKEEFGAEGRGRQPRAVESTSRTPEFDHINCTSSHFFITLVLGLVDAMGNLKMLAERDTSFVLISRAPLAKLEKYKKERGWSLPWYSSFGTDFNYDFHVTLDRTVVQLEYNYREQAELEQRQKDEPHFFQGESHGLSVFFHIDDDVFHTYSTYARGCESLTDSYRLLDRTPYGRQEDFEVSPTGWPQRPTYG